MKRKKSFIGILIWLLVLFMVVPPLVFAQDEGTAKKFKQEELDQMLAPLALYPDDLLTQILMASTYPLEIVQADRWVKANKNLKGDQFTAALEKQTWDPSVKSLINFPEVLTMMNEKLDWTMKLGDAFLASEKDVMDTVQKLRLKAQEAGNLKSTEQQKVIVQEKIIVIEPAQPNYVYVPVYNPTIVYGTWWWPAYPPHYYYPPYYAYPPVYGFAAGVAIGAAWGYAWGHCNWHGGNVNININQNTNINNNINRNKYANQLPAGSSGQGKWQHDASHRQGVAYRDQATAQKYNRGASTQDVKSRDVYRGRTEQGGQSLQLRQETGRTGGQAGQQRRDDAFSGMGDGNKTRDYSDRGNSSRDRMSSSSGGRGGGSWGGGGRGGGFGGGGRGGGGRR